MHKATFYCIIKTNCNINTITSETRSETRAPSRGWGEDRGRTETPTAGN